MEAKEWDERYRGADLVWGVGPNQFVREQCERLPVGAAVDLACGEGRNAIWLARLGWTVTGYDYSEAAIARAGELTAALPAETSGRLTWAVHDVRSLELSPDSVDLSLICYLQVTDADLDPVVLQAARALRSGGHLLIVGHDRRNLADGVGGPRDITRLHSPEHLRNTLSTLPGVDVETATTVERSTDAGVALDTLVLARRS
ncbi:MAG: class I SAM-dependent methyltransferase [Nocardioidaceae bacterium]